MPWPLPYFYPVLMAVPCVSPVSPPLPPFLPPFIPFFLPAFLPHPAIPEPPARTLDNERIRNLIPEPAPAATQPPRSRQQPFDYDGEVYIGGEDGVEEEGALPEETGGEQGGEEEEEEEHNQLNPRGDVFGKPCFLGLGRSLSLKSWS